MAESHIVLICFCVVLCLVVDTNTRSVTDNGDVTSVGDLSPPLKASRENSDTDFCNPDPCKNGGQCLKFSKKCTCLSGFSGVYCENCKCENGFCKEDDKGDSVCTCPPEWGLYSNAKCKRCDCGKDFNCTYDPSFLTDRKKCLCRDGYEDRNGTCIEILFPSTSTSVSSPTATGNSASFWTHHTTANKTNDTTLTIGITGWTVLPVSTAESSSGSHFLNFTDEVGSSVRTSTTDSTTKTGPCSDRPCLNGGTCVDYDNLWLCSCKKPYMGILCELDPCDLIVCFNGGICKIENNTASCYCKEPFSGEFCESRKNICLPNPCKNGGVCNATKEGVTCQCRKGFVGADCSLDVCSPNPCRNGGNCSATSGGVTCYCTERFTGADCSIKIPFPPTSTSVSTPNTTRNSTSFSTHYPTKNETNNYTRTSWTVFPVSTEESSSGGNFLNFTDDVGSTVRTSTNGPTTNTGPCSESPCQNGGTCVVVSDSWKCLCKKPYLGILCETDPCDWNPCKNGGLCKIENDTVSCYCKEPFAGEFCESRTKMDLYVIILVAVSVFLAIALIFVTCVLCQRYRVMKTN